MQESQEEKLVEYYQSSADQYDAMQLHEGDEHYNALMFLRGILAEKKYDSLLDVGAGTGRALFYLKEIFPDMDLTGVEPMSAMRQQAIKKGLSSEQIIEAQGQSLPFPNKSIDCVTAFGILHHIQDPEPVIKEIFRVAKKAVFISDHNIYGMGSSQTKFFKQLLRKSLGFHVLSQIMTKGKGYHDTDYDGIFYPFSLFEHLDGITNKATETFLLSTKGKAIDLYKDASHVAILAILEN
ncbi:Methyltransferase type 11 [[Leptolyngbya] sp. PCC 7376]|uniref:class I SAM-dependent methyltransferase n=1 Tax=[Leptolyngbya] sp. PCC 7376 TaxID=111781 RepID=UPI00029F4325|nr:methyltransferase domain-containing protein [[Leptolyngbya] sp. PCC 7376]AFY38000.1 Methyltransferase type 11 [[Leptolyngbya] sp. PCC 7376]